VKRSEKGKKMRKMMEMISDTKGGKGNYIKRGMKEKLSPCQILFFSLLK